MRLLCDQMLRGLARWLRAAGYDTEIAAQGERDRDILRRCREEGRVLLTRDRHLADLAQTRGRVLLLGADGIEAAARELRDRLGIDWLHAPFTRCLVDNAALDEAGPECWAKVPEQSRTGSGPLRLCPVCFRLYWPGGHVRRMHDRLAAWRR